MKLLLFTSLFLLMANLSNAQWVEQGCNSDDPGGFVNSVSIPENGTIWLGLERAGWNVPQCKAAVSSDDGATWTYSIIDSVPNYFGLKVKGISADTAFASTIKFPLEDSSRIYRTVNGGQSWDLIPTAFSGEYEACIDFHFFDANEGVAFGAPILGPMTIYRTMDGGSTWTKVQPQNLPVPMNQEGMFIFSGNGSYGVSGDNIWFGTTRGRIYKSTDRGQNWDAYTIDSQITIHSVAFKDDNNGVAVSAASALAQSYISGRAFTTSDGGVTWTQSSNVQNNPRMGNIHYLPGSANTYVTVYGWSQAGTGTQISTDGGVTWNIYGTDRIAGVDFLDENYGWGGGITSTPSEGVYKWDGTVLSNPELTSKKVSVYPTITKDQLTINGGTISSVKCFDQMGKEMAIELVDETIKVEHLANGAYILLIESGKHIQRVKFVVNKN